MIEVGQLYYFDLSGWQQRWHKATDCELTGYIVVTKVKASNGGPAIRWLGRKGCTDEETDSGFLEIRCKYITG